MDVGFRGYVFKRSASGSLLFAIRSVAKGGFHIDPALAGEIIGLSAIGLRRPPDHASTLTAREEHVLRQIAFGLTLKEVATQLGVTEKSIETYKARASEKLKLRSRANIVQYGVSQGWFRDALV
jgi:DNA-binding NarL/FixJ family response regulator